MYQFLSNFGTWFNIRSFRIGIKWLTTVYHILRFSCVSPIIERYFCYFRPWAFQPFLFSKLFHMNKYFLFVKNLQRLLILLLTYIYLISQFGFSKFLLNKKPAYINYVFHSEPPNWPTSTVSISLKWFFSVFSLLDS